MALKKILGLDIGTTSVGWAVVKQLEDNKWTIDDFGVRIFDEPIDNSDISSAAKRRTFRSKRRLLRRRSRRIRDLKYYLQKYGPNTFKNIVNEIKDHFNKLNDKNQNYKYSDSVNPYKLRKMAIEGKAITPLQFAIVLINIAKRRGYDDSFITKFNNSEEIKNDHDYKDKIKLGKDLIEKYKYPIIALEHLEIFVDKNNDLLKDEHKLNKEYKYVRNTTPKQKTLKLKKETNKSHNFFYFSRADYFNEVKEIIRQQKKHLNLSEDLIKRLIIEDESENKRWSTIFRQRPFEDGPGNPNDQKRKYKGFSQDNVGNDIFLNEKRMWSSLIVNDLFILISEVSKLNIFAKTKKEDLIKFNQNIILKYLDFIFKDDKTFKKEFLLCASSFNIQIDKENFKILDKFKISNLFLNKLYQFIKNDFLKKEIIEIKEFVFQKNKDYSSINTDKFILDKFGNLIAENITPWFLLKKLKEENEKFYYEFDESKIDNYNKISKDKVEFKDFDEKIKYAVSKFSTSPSKVSYKYACMALDSFIFCGEKYGDFQAKFNKDNKDNVKNIVKIPFGPIIDFDLAKNPVVMRALSQARKVVKRLYEEYKWFDSIVVESARELTSSLKDKRKIKLKQDKNYIENQKISSFLDTQKILDKNVNKRKMKLYNRQKGLSIYSGKKIDISRLDDYEIDHIIPRSQINDDSFDNTVLVLKEENQIKKNRTPLEAGNDLIQDIKSYKSRCLDLKKSGLISERKYVLLMAKSANDEAVKNIVQQIASRELNDTRYISKYFTNYLKKSIELYCIKNVEYKKPDNNKIVFNPTGSLTSGYRKAWLSSSGWGLEIKNRDISHFHHAVDAIVLCNMASESRIKFYTDCLRISNLVKKIDKSNFSEEERQKNIKELDDIYKEIVDSWEKQKKHYGLWFPNYKQKFEDIKNMKYTSFSKIAPPLVSLEELQNHVNKRIPIELIIEKKYKDDKNPSYYEYEAKLKKIIWEEEYNNKKIDLLDEFPKSNIRYPFISYKQNNKIKGNFLGSENYIGIHSDDFKKYSNNREIEKNGFKIIMENDKETIKGIIDIRKYYGTLVLKDSKEKLDFVKIRRFDIINKFKSKLKELKERNFNQNKIDINDIHIDFFKEHVSNKSQNTDNHILAVLRPGTIFSAFDKTGERKVFVYKSLSDNRICAPYIFIPQNNHSQVTGRDIRYSKSSLSEIKVLKIDILGRKIN